MLRLHSRVIVSGSKDQGAATMMQTGPALSRQAQYAQVNGLKMYYEESGSGQPLILLHGGTVTSKMWEAHIPIFARYFRVIAPDSRGHGRTNNPAGELSYRSMADDVVALIHTLDLDRPLICGYSDGGHFALEVGMRYPDLAAGAGSRRGIAQNIRGIYPIVERIGVRWPWQGGFPAATTGGSRSGRTVGSGTCPER